MDVQGRTLILVSGNSGLAGARALYNKIISENKDPLIVSFSDSNLEGGGGLSVRGLQYYQDNFKINLTDIRKEACKLLDSFSGQKLRGEISLSDATKYNNVSLWELSAHYLFSRLVPILYALNMAQAILDHEKPGEAYLVGRDAVLEQIFFLLCESKNIHFSSVAPKKSIFKSPAMILKVSLFRAKKIKRFAVSTYLFLSNLLKSKKMENSYKVIFFVPPERFFLSMLPVILKYNQKERLVVNGYLTGSSKKMKQNNIFYTDFYGYKIYPLSTRKVRGFLNDAGSVLMERRFLKNILYNGLPLGSLLVGVLEDLVNEQFPEKIRQVDIVRNIIFVFKPKVVVVNDCAYDLVLIAKSLSVPVLAMQSMHPGDFIFFSKNFADAVTVDGNQWKEYLIEQDYDPEKIWVTGFSRLEYLKHEKSLAIDLDRTQEGKKRKIVVFAPTYSSLTQGVLKYQNAERAKNVCLAMKNIKDAFLVIKMHPYEKDTAFYRKIAEETKIGNFRILKSIDMMSLISLSDLLIAHTSAAAYEAVLMGKNVIILSAASDLCSEDIWNFRKFNVVKTIDNFGELEQGIRDMLFSDGGPAPSLAKKREEYIFRHAYKIDGNSGIRVREVIDKLCSG